MAELLHAHARMSTDNRALVWPGPSPNLTFVPRRPQQRLGSQAGYESWRHPLAPKLPTSQYHMPAPNPEIAAQTDNAQGGITGERRIPEKAAARPGTPTTRRDQTYHQDQDLDLHPLRNFVPDYSEGPVAGHAKCWLTENMFQQPWLAANPLGQLR